MLFPVPNNARWPTLPPPNSFCTSQFLLLQTSTIISLGPAVAVVVIVLDVVVSSRRQRQSLLSLWIGLDWRATPAGHQSRSVPNSLNAIRHSERDGSSPLLFSAWLPSEGIDWESKETPEAVGEGTLCCCAAVLPCCRLMEEIRTVAAIDLMISALVLHLSPFFFLICAALLCSVTSWWRWWRCRTAAGRKLSGATRRLSSVLPLTPRTTSWWVTTQGSNGKWEIIVLTRFHVSKVDFQLYFERLGHKEKLERNTADGKKCSMVENIQIYFYPH